MIWFVPIALLLIIGWVFDTPKSIGEIDLEIEEHFR